MNKFSVLCVKAQGLRLLTVTWMVFFSMPFAAWILGAFPISPPSWTTTNMVTSLPLPASRFAQWVQCFVVSIVVAMLLTWLDSLRLGGLLVAKRLMTTFWLQTRGKRSFLALVFFALGFYVLASEYRFINALHPYALNVFLVIAFGAAIHLFRPPVALALTSSCADCEDFLDLVSSSLFPLRTVMLLDTSRVQRQLHMTEGDNLRTFEFANWEIAVQTLMDSVPLIVIDGRNPSTVVAKELEWICQSSLRSSRTIIVSDNSGRIQLDTSSLQAGQLLSLKRCVLLDIPATIWQVLQPHERSPS